MKKEEGKKYPDLKIAFLAFLLYNKSKKEMTDELNYIATVNIKESDNSDCDYINNFQQTLQYLKKFFNLDYKIRVSKCYFCNDDDDDEFSPGLQEYYDSGYYDYDSYDIEITGLSKFWHAYECYIKKACDGILIGRELEHPNKQTMEFHNIIIEKNNSSGSSEIYFSFEDISNYYNNFHLNFLELLQTKIDKKEFELTGDILGEHKRGGILPYKFRSIRISGIPQLKEAEIVYHIKFSKEPLKITLNGYSMLDKEKCRFSTNQRKMFIYICEHPCEKYSLDMFSQNSLTENRASITKFNKVVKSFLSKIGLEEVSFLVSTYSGNAEYQINEKFKID